MHPMPGQCGDRNSAGISLRAILPVCSRGSWSVNRPTGALEVGNPLSAEGNEFGLQHGGIGRRLTRLHHGPHGFPHVRVAHPITANVADSGRPISASSTSRG